MRHKMAMFIVLDLPTVIKHLPTVEDHNLEI